MSVDYLMKEGRWMLRGLSAHCDTDLQSYIVHDCPVARGDRYWYSTVSQDAPCNECGHGPPVAMTGAWRLHNWDFIQKDLR